MCYSSTLSARTSMPSPRSSGHETMIALRSILHNLAVVAVGFVVALVGVTLDRLFAIGEFRSIFAAVFGSLLICIGFLIRLWATYLFYKSNMKVIVTAPQSELRSPRFIFRSLIFLFDARRDSWSKDLATSGCVTANRYAGGFEQLNNPFTRVLRIGG
jgi:hypothetical protein